MKHLKQTFFILLLLISATLYAQTYSIMFYNVENLFDTIRNPKIQDEDFTPQGAKRWDSRKYWEQIDRITEVFQKIGAATGGFPILIGVSEVENRDVVQDLANSPRISAARYNIVLHDESRDGRGINLAFLYRSDVIEYVSSKPIPVRFSDNTPSSRTRGILWFTGKIDGEVFHFFNNHWPSRRGGQRASEPRRIDAATTLRYIVDSLQKADPLANIVIMGDFNDDPNNRSVERTLRAKGNKNRLAQGDLFNPFHAMHRAGLGTLAFQDRWNLFDMVIVCQNLSHGKENTFLLHRLERSNYYGFIFNRPFLVQQEGRFKGYPWRTYVGDVYQGGYSDHFPVYVYIRR